MSDKARFRSWSAGLHSPCLPLASPCSGRKHSQRDARLHAPSGSVPVTQNPGVQWAGIDTVPADGAIPARVKHRHTRGSLLRRPQVLAPSRGPRSKSRHLSARAEKYRPVSVTGRVALNLTESTEQPS